MGFVDIGLPHKIFHDGGSNDSGNDDDDNDEAVRGGS